MCLKCQRTFSTPGQAKVHFKEIHMIDRNDRKFNCHLCSKSFAIKRYLSNHIRAIHGLSQTLLKNQYMPHQWNTVQDPFWRWSGPVQTVQFKWSGPYGPVQSVQSNQSIQTVRSKWSGPKGPKWWNLANLSRRFWTWAVQLGRWFCYVSQM